MRILMVYPQYPDTFWSFAHALRFIGKKASLPPMGLLTVAAMIPGEWEVKLVDTNFTALGDEEISWADYVFISAMTIQKDSAKKIIARCQELGRKVVAGGPLFTALTQEFPEVDHLVLNEAENTFPELLRDLRQGTLKRVYRSDRWADIAVSPVPRWDLINIKHYATMCVQYSRGCPFDCDFCDITVLYGRAPRAKPSANVITELEALYARGWRGTVFFVDDNFIGNKKLIKNELLPAVIGWMKKRKYPFTFLTQASINLAEDEELMRLMVKAGFDTVFVGIETPDETSLVECGKLHNTRSDLLANVKKLQAFGLQVQAGFIVGFDSDKHDIFNRISRFINESGIVASMVGLLNAPPGTKLYKRLISENRILKGSSGDNTDFSLNFLPKMDSAVLIEGYKKIIRDIYRPEAYYRRIRTFLRNYHLGRRLHVYLSKSHLQGVFMSFYKLGVRRGVRRHFWKLMIWTIFRKPRLMPEALTMAIYGAHFMRHFDTLPNERRG
ncbi:MAG: B12-binding domain-containing radical SAM protein [Candidatus Glassbacteria bacterium RIFCSPLOWO2_12_FULL_58_11]|uniref:B12-binding domain-containing radical SAM protein n=1 Tax=Candidatus Glassbacteria bacterium RIFCSPLOWO2_12_FULL_58_11 TaxID=1817867 RepID=A0A1F5YJY0_9BACT|nr:MAG: B12-binding domain-containing radical SAM protein [Candidatus Glassbacteria bacterium RIFCSPLOWO2_12_FULL_58_11]